MTNQLLWIALAILAGAMIPVQTASNTALGKSLGHPFWSSFAVFIVAMLAIAATILVTRIDLPTGAAIWSAPWWAWLGGLLGAVYIFLLIYLAPKLGIGTVTALVVAGQILAAVVIDHFGLLNFPVHGLSIYRVAGVALMIAGVTLIRLF